MKVLTHRAIRRAGLTIVRHTRGWVAGEFLACNAEDATGRPVAYHGEARSIELSRGLSVRGLLVRCGVRVSAPSEEALFAGIARLGYTV